MVERIVSVALALSCCGSVGAQATTDGDAAPPSEVVTFASALRDVTDVDRLWRAPWPGERTVQFSSYDRASDAGPDAADPDAWFANDDRGHWSRIDDRPDGTREYVLVDTAGPGVLVRLWSANPAGALRFYLDDDVEPRWTVDFAAVTAGETSPIDEPLAGIRARGANLHVPIPFARRLRIASDVGGGLRYHAGVRRLPEGTMVESFRPEFLRSQAGELVRARMAMMSAGVPLRVGAAVRRERGGTTVSAVRLRAGVGAVWSHTVDGPSVIRGLRLRARPAVPDRRPEVLRDLVLNVVVDGERTVCAPLADFFGSAPRFDAWTGLALGVANDGWGYCWFPMPVPSQARIEVVAEQLPCGLEFEWELHTEPATAAELEDALLFRSTWRLARDVSTRPFSDHVVLDVASGRGRFVGCGLSVRNPSRAWWGEGDERVTVDDEAFPSTFGTGTEDYFGYAWATPQPFSSPLHALVRSDGPAHFGVTTANRLQLADAIPFRRSLRFAFEVWHHETDVSLDVASIAWWYAAPGARLADADRPLPRAAERRPVPLEAPYRLIAEGLLEAESIEHRLDGRGEVRPQGLRSGADGSWSRDEHLWWTGGADGDRLVLRVPIRTAATYRVGLAMTKAPDYGIVRVALNGAPLGDGPVDLYATSVVPTGVVWFGEHELTEGEAELSFELVGTNPQAKPERMVGVDYVRLEMR